MTNIDPTASSCEGPGSGPGLSLGGLGTRVEGGRKRRTRAALPPMPLGKRVFDIVVSLLLLALLWPVLLLTTLVLLLLEGRPIFYVGERMCSPDRSFMQIKFRTMRVGADAVGGVTGGDKAASISPLHRVLRRTRADELPQLINVLKGEMSLVGPRPPMRSYVEAFPEIYTPVLQSRPGVTGLATLRFHQHEERLLAPCRTHRETEAVYRRRCIPRKARLDLIYQKRRSLWLDLSLVAETATKPFWRVHHRNQFPMPQTVVTARVVVAVPSPLAAAQPTPLPISAHPAE